MTATSTTYAPAPVTTGRPTLPRLMRSEWIKLRTLRSTVWCFALEFLLLAGFAALFTPFVVDQLRDQLALPGVPASDLMVSVGFSGLTLSMLVAGVLGVLVISGEYSTGMIRSSFSAAPRRLGVIAAKAIVYTGVTFLVTAIAVATALLTAHGYFAAAGADVDLLTRDVLLSALGGVLFVVLIGMMGFGFGLLLRNGAAGIGALVGLVLVVPIVGSLLGGVLDWVADLEPYFPLSAGNRLYSSGTGAPGELEFWQALLVMLGWVVVILVPALILAKKRDA
ncbi:ABC-2 type transport system permease protein [Clavibacter michiganensis]|uniref:ABC transporter permease subunit n=1 Tax=Clavibacter michiganensis TaxID=28447 RepID=UPI001957E693|nr:ABC transporter permease subunit [Clavibacter michiganensis]MBM7410452.1 ABC-2 type transport system permease protein [Clavibacter michiganensis]